MPHVTWTRGGAADFTSADDERITMRSTTSGAPGSRPEGTLEDGRKVRIKVHRCRRVTSEDGSDGFSIEGRLIDATRGLRDHIASLTAEPASSESNA